MTASLMDVFTSAYGGMSERDDLGGKEVMKTFADTFAVIQAGWGELVTRNMRRAYPSVSSPMSDANSINDPEHAALVWGTAAHALDYDDVHTTSVNHPSAVIVPAIEAAARAEKLSRARVSRAYLMGLAVNIAVGEVLGFDHYVKGWHATSTIGPLSAAAAVAYLMNLDERAFRSALSLAAAQAGGMQRNFGEMAKPVQAGLAASAGVRAARMAANGIGGANNAFGEKGFIDLYKGAVPGKSESEVVFTPDASTLSRKLYACCYQAHRPITAALEVRKQLDPSVLTDPDLNVEVRVPFGGTAPLRILLPSTGLEGKFSGPYAVATALTDGHVSLGAFEDKNVLRPELQCLSNRVVLIEDELDGPMPPGINHGTIRLTVRRDKDLVASAEVAHFPGSPEQPITDAELETKAHECAEHSARKGESFVAASELMANAERCAPVN
jgi:2-methylcitrate dehydratase PrpD